MRRRGGSTMNGAPEHGAESVSPVPGMTRRVLLTGALGTAGATLLGVPGAPWAAAAPAGMTPEEVKLFADAKKVGMVDWWTAHYQLSAAEAVLDAFVARYRVIEVQL